MQALAKFQVEKSIFGAGVRQLLISQAGVDTAAITEGNSFAVWPTSSSSEAFEGISPLLAVVASSPQSKSANLIPTQPSELRAATMQWCSLASQLASKCVSLSDVEARLNIVPPAKNNFLVTGAEKPSAADFLLLASLKGSLKQCKIEAPALYKWAESIIKKNDTCQQFCSLDETSTATGDGDNNKQQQQQKAAAAAAGGKQEFAIPNAAEIAARRAAKEQAKKEKAEKEAAAKAASGDAAATSKPTSSKNQQQELTPDQGLDLRVGRITDIAAHPTADRLYVETIDVAEASGPRTIISGLVNFYKPEELKDQLVVVVCNMKPKKLVGTDSHGMVLCASTPESVKIIQPPATAKPGDCVSFGKNADAAVPTKAIPSSNKMGQLLEQLRTDDNGIVMWKDVPLTIGGEHPVTAPLKGVPVK